MGFNKETAANELEAKIALAFDNDRSVHLPTGPIAYMFLGWHTTDQQGRVMITTREMSFETLKAQVDDIKAALDARLAEAKARFEAASPH